MNKFICHVIHDKYHGGSIGFLPIKKKPLDNYLDYYLTNVTSVVCLVDYLDVMETEGVKPMAIKGFSHIDNFVINKLDITSMPPLDVLLRFYSALIVKLQSMATGKIIDKVTGEVTIIATLEETEFTDSHTELQSGLVRRVIQHDLQPKMIQGLMTAIQLWVDSKDFHFPKT